MILLLSIISYQTAYYQFFIVYRAKVLTFKELSKRFITKKFYSIKIALFETDNT